MPVCSLSSVKNRIVLGEPLPFSVRDATQMLLLARGQVIVDEAQLQALFKRGAVVELEELAEAVQAVRSESPALRHAQLPQEWERHSREVKRALSAPSAELAGALHKTTDQLLALIEFSPDMALSQVVRQPDSGAGHYGVNHSIHAATACQAAARYLGWNATEQRRAFQAALTMNLSMFDLQARLAQQVSPLTAKQRETINEHPTRSAEMLSQAGITDQDWLDAVIQHHEMVDGSGYPSGATDVSELAEMLRLADVYTARLNSRANRPAMSAQQAGRELHQMAGASPLATALIKAFGVFPPGSLVKLASGEMGLVVRNGERAHWPLVVALTNANGAPRGVPVTRDSAQADHAVVALLSAQAMPMRLTDEMVAGLIANQASSA
ncbi:MAG TPA: HD domain-containing phosphohydrolase [Ideonella sp.]|uniref:HD-GYP domain-containing protein n=1 Tax=Ideonella sp. TaxID=1929293 RepID=UPI002C79DE12|nr:HD domain-containing phosphohydrolase [Ideonella sp.]HSI51927.1 HD domain-containing phosphohydrolase [Ideonella sp.]